EAETVLRALPRPVGIGGDDVLHLGELRRGQQPSAEQRAEEDVHIARAGDQGSSRPAHRHVPLGVVDPPDGAVALLADVAAGMRTPDTGLVARPVGVAPAAGPAVPEVGLVLQGAPGDY